MNVRIIPLLAIVLFVGSLFGAFFFRDVRARPAYHLTPCASCWSANELAGALASATIQHAPGVLPNVVMETDKTIAIRYQDDLTKKWFVLFPKKDIKDIGDLSPEDETYITDAYAVMSELIKKENLREYQIFTNGPWIQHIRYLHFHLIETIHTTATPSS